MIHFLILQLFLFFYAFNKQQDIEFLYHYLQTTPNINNIERLKIMKKFVAIYYGFAFIKICTERNLPIITEKEIATLPNIRKYYQIVGNDLLKTDKTLQEFGFVLINTALQNDP